MIANNDCKTNANKITQQTITQIIDNYFESQNVKLVKLLKSYYKNPCSPDIKKGKELLAAYKQISMETRETLRKNIDTYIDQLCLLGDLSIVLLEEHGLTKEVYDDCVKYLLESFEDIVMDVADLLYLAK